MKRKRVSVYFTAFFSLSLLFTACKKERVINESEIVQTLEGEDWWNGCDHLFHGQTPELVPFKIAEQEVVFEKYGDQYLLEGDILMDIDGIRKLQEFNQGAQDRGAVTAVASKKWPNSIAYYTIDEGFSIYTKNAILWSIEIINNETNINLVKRTDQEDYINVILTGGANYSNSIGKLGGEQTVGLSSTPGTITIIHELLHALGIWHEQSRQDRDDYITIHWDNIEPGKENNFQKYSAPNGNDYGDFNFSSYMMYFPTAFRKSGTPYTITKLNGSTSWGYTYAGRDIDFATINSMYLKEWFFLNVKVNGNRLRPVSTAGDSKVKHQDGGTGHWVQWKKVISNEKGYFHLLNRNTNKYLRPVSAGTSDLRMISSNGDWTKWKFDVLDDGSMHIINKETASRIKLKNSNLDIDALVEGTVDPSKTGTWTRWTIEDAN